MRGFLARSLCKLPLGKISVWDVSFCAVHDTRFVPACTVEMLMGIFARAILPGILQGKCQTLMPAQSKRTWTFHKNHFEWKFTGKMPDATDTTSIKLKHGALTIAIRTPQCGHTVWGIAGNMQETLDYKSPSIQVNSSNFWLAQDITNHNFKMHAFLGSAPQHVSPREQGYCASSLG